MGIISTAKTIGGSAKRGGLVKGTADGARSTTNANNHDESKKSQKSEAANTTDLVTGTAQKDNDTISSSTAIADMQFAKDTAQTANGITKSCGETFKALV
jgi:hypothetical protein